jgi:hypothetical protein
MKRLVNRCRPFANAYFSISASSRYPIWLPLLPDTIAIPLTYRASPFDTAATVTGFPVNFVERLSPVSSQC